MEREVVPSLRSFFAVEETEGRGGEVFCPGGSHGSQAGLGLEF